MSALYLDDGAVYHAIFIYSKLYPIIPGLNRVYYALQYGGLEHPLITI